MRFDFFRKDATRPTRADRERERRRNREVKVLTLSFIEDRQEYILSEMRTTFGDLPAEAVHVTGRKRTYFVDTVDVPDTGQEDMRAVDLNLWLKNNSINDALAISFDAKKQDMDILKMVAIGAAVIIGLCIVWSMVI